MLHIIYEFAYDVSVFRIQMAKKGYVIYKGKVPGVYEHWEDCLDGLVGVQSLTKSFFFACILSLIFTLFGFAI